jgi:hypothetical protein
MLSKSLNAYIEVITNPLAAFRAVFAGNLSIWPPFVITLLLVLLTSYFTYDAVMAQQVRLLDVNPDVTEEAYDATVQGMSMMQKGVGRYLGMLVIPLIVLPLMYLIYALLGLIVGRFLLGGAGKFDQYFKVAVYASAVSAVGAMVTILLVLITGSAPFSYSPAEFLPINDFFTTQYKLLLSLDIFMLWYLVAVGFGVKVINDFSPAKAMLVPFSIFIVWTLVQKLVF